MDEAITGSIDRMKEKALRNERQDKDDLLSILSLDSKSEESLYLAKVAKEVALESVYNSKKAGLLASCGLDPIGPEHTNEEIVEKLEIYREKIEAVAVCTMKRVAVKGTPKYDLREISKERHTQMIAVVRMAMGKRAMVPMHPLNADGLDWGCNHMSVEIGANPRNDDMENVKWYPFPSDEVKKLMIEKGFEIGTIDDFRHIVQYGL